MTNSSPLNCTHTINTDKSHGYLTFNRTNLLKKNYREQHCVVFIVTIRFNFHYQFLGVTALINNLLLVREMKLFGK